MGGTTRLNPLTRIGSRELREGLLEAVTRAMLDRPLTQAEHVGLSGALMEADRLAGDAEVCIPDVLEQLREPTHELADELMVGGTEEARDELRECALALKRLCRGPLAGMFDGPTTAGSTSGTLPPSRSTLGGARRHRRRRPGAGDHDGLRDDVPGRQPRRAQARDAEARGKTARRSSAPTTRRGGRRRSPAWASTTRPPSSSRAVTGVQHWLVLHRFSDLRAAGDEGTRQQRLAEGLLADASTTIVYHQHAKEAAFTSELLGLSSTEGELIKTLHQGEALWRVGNRSFLVYHVLSDLEQRLVDTDSAMLELDPHHEPELVDHYAARHAAGDGLPVMGPDGAPLHAAGAAPEGEELAP